jgi:hypothetical protein
MPQSRADILFPLYTNRDMNLAPLNGVTQSGHELGTAEWHRVDTAEGGDRMGLEQGTSQVLRLSTGFLYKVLYLSTMAAVRWPGACLSCPTYLICHVITQYTSQVLDSCTKYCP